MPLYPPGGGGGVSDHGALTGLADDDHTAYATNAEFDDHSARHENGGADEISIAGLDGTPAELTNHLNDAADAHDASAISFDDTGLTITAADVQTMGEQLDAAISAGGIPATIFDAAGDIIVASAADTAVRLAKGADGTFLGVAAGAVGYYTPAGGSGLLAVNSYAPTSQTVFTSTGTAMQDVDATNMVVTFTAPASGNVLVRLSAYADTTSAAAESFWGLRESTTNLTGIARILREATDEGYTSVAIYLTGVTAGSHTYKWAYGASSGTTRIIVQDGSAIGEWGPGIMEVWAAP